MIPVILFGAVLAVGVLSLCAMAAAARKRVARWRAHRAREKAREARLAEGARRRAEQLAKTGALTGVFQTLEESARFARVSGPPVVPPRARMAKGSTPFPMVQAPASVGAASPPVSAPRLERAVSGRRR